MVEDDLLALGPLTALLGDKIGLAFGFQQLSSYLIAISVVYV